MGLRGILGECKAYPMFSNFCSAWITWQRTPFYFLYRVSSFLSIFLSLSVMMLSILKGHTSELGIPVSLILHTPFILSGEIHALLGWSKNVLQFWLCYIRKMVQLQVLDLIFSLTGHFTLSETACTMECGKVVVILGYPLGFDWVMGKYQ